MANLFLHKLLTLFLAPITCSAGFGRANASRASGCWPTSTIKSRPQFKLALPSRFPNDRFKLSAHRRSQFIYDLEKIHFGQPLRTPQQKGQRTRGFGSRIVFANPVE